MVKILIGRKYYVRRLNKKILCGSSSTTNEPYFEIVCNCIHELLGSSSTRTYYSQIEPLFRYYFSGYDTH